MHSDRLSFHCQYLTGGVCVTVVDVARPRTGPKSKADYSSLPLRGAPKKGVKRIAWFAKKYLITPSGYGQGKPLVLRPWQKELLAGLFPEAKERPYEALVSMPRGNGKSSLAAVLALYTLLAEGRQAPKVLIVASDIRQANIIFSMVRRMVELSPELAKRCVIYKDRLEVPGNGGLLMPLPSEERALQGWSFDLCLVDELAQVDEMVYQSMLLALGKVPDSQLLSISTPCLNASSVMKGLVDDAKENPRDDFYYYEMSATHCEKVDCETCWKQANPALGDFLSVKAMKSVLRSSREAAFRAYRLGQWPDKADDAWIARSALEAVLTDSEVPKGSKVVLAVDGSFSGDMTAIVAVTVEKKPKAQLIKAWKPQQEAQTDYRVPIEQVELAIRDTCKDYDVREILFDPYRWSRSMQVLAAERLPVIEFPQSIARMSPATALATAAINNQNIEIVRDDTLEQHILNAHVREDSRGIKIQKENKDSKKKIDGAVCLVMAHSRAHFLANKRGGKVYRSRG